MMGASYPVSVMVVWFLMLGMMEMKGKLSVPLNA